MCGIGVLIPKSESWRSEPGLCRRIARILEHRGPDDLGFLTLSSMGAIWSGRDHQGPLGPVDAALIHRRLSIIDKSDSGRQPMSTADQRFHIVFNGEIYNYVELRSELKDLGHTFASSSDTEVLLAAFKQWGSECLSRLLGMFAFTILDRLERKLFVARDRFGIKPLYYVEGAFGTAFASEIQALLELPSVSRKANPSVVYEYLLRGSTDHAESTFFEAIRQFPPAAFAEVCLDQSGHVNPISYWHLPVDKQIDLSFEEAGRRFRDLFVDSVKMHLRSDVPIGANLSGGLDSSAVVIAIHEILGRQAPIELFTYSADDRSINEDSWVDIVATQVQYPIHKVTFSSDDIAREVDPIIVGQDYPFASLSMFAENRIYRRVAQQGIKVTLGGQGADEYLAGYQGYVSARLASLFRAGDWSTFSRLLNSAAGNRNLSKRSLLSVALSYLLPDSLHSVARSVVGKTTAPSWLNQNWFESSGFQYRPSGYVSGYNILKSVLQQDMTQKGLHHHLRSEDRSSMMYSVESRVPFLDHRLVEFVLSLPESYIITDDGTSKAIFREAMKGLLPEQIRTRRDKIGFQTGEDSWMQPLAKWINGILTSEYARSIPVFNHKELLRIWDLHKHGSIPFDWRVWRWVNFMRWSERLSVEFTDRGFKSGRRESVFHA